ncbi:MAG: preprotein translocase subunit SecE [Candidatus Buchananbacteria bacterium]|nr:preprotein translocase subunit SecE [Candidatus Buchananbacteria bacterium]
MNIAKSITDYFIGARQELKKVVWPSKKEVIQHTSMVIAISLGVALFLGVIVDYTLTFFLKFII